MAPNILFLHNKFGSGHESAAMAAEAACRARWPDLNSRVTDSIKYTNPIAHKLYEQAYGQVVKYWPESWDYVYFGKGIFTLTHQMLKVFDEINCRRIAKVFDEFRPEVIVSMHPFCSSVVSVLKQKEVTDAKLVTVGTDFHVHRLYIQPETDLYIVAADQVRERFARAGVPRDIVAATGIPVDPVFAAVPDRPDARAALGFEADTMTVTVVFGGAGIGPFRKILESLGSLEAPLQVVAITGRNNAAKRSLKKFTPKADMKLVVKGFVTDMALHLAASDVVITKPGGVTLSECLAAGVPLIPISPHPGQEMGNVDFLLSNNVCDYADGPHEAAALLARYMSEPAELDRIRRQTRAMGRPHSARDLAQEISTRFFADRR